MTQFKEKASRQKANAVSAGLFDYPVLMAADILLYDTDLVPVGEDQKQHLELTREIARRFNGTFGTIFKVPECYVPSVGARIMNLQNPARKMSKSDNDATGSILLTDDADTIRSKVTSAVTDSGRIVEYDETRPAIANLCSIYSCATGAPLERVGERFAEGGYGTFKRELADAIIAVLSPIQKRFYSVREDSARLSTLLAVGAASARERSEATLSRVQDALGIVPR
jgi:tryptophanyl-tRNA synthetase